MSRNLKSSLSKRKLNLPTKWVVDPSNRAKGVCMELATTNTLCESALAELEADIEAQLKSVRQEYTQLRAENLELRNLKYQLEKHLSKAVGAIRIGAEATIQVSELANQTLK